MSHPTFVAYILHIPFINSFVFFFLFIYFILFISGVLRQKDVEQALILEEKMGLQLKLLASAGVENLPIETPSYCHLVAEHQDPEKIRKKVQNAIQVINVVLFWHVHFF